MEYYWELRSENAQNIKALMRPLHVQKILTCKGMGWFSLRSAGNANWNFSLIQAVVQFLFVVVLKLFGFLRDGHET